MEDEFLKVGEISQEILDLFKEKKLSNEAKFVVLKMTKEIIKAERRLEKEKNRESLRGKDMTLYNKK